MTHFFIDLLPLFQKSSSKITIRGRCAIGNQQIVGNGNDKYRGDLRDEAGYAQGSKPPGNLQLGNKIFPFQLDGLKPEQTDGKKGRIQNLPQDGGPSGTFDSPLAQK